MSANTTRSAFNSPDRASAPELALVVCTRNRADQLDKFLRHIAALPEPGFGWELVIVDNGSSDETPERLKKFSAMFGARAAVIKTTAPGLGRARNSGWRRTKAAIIAFTDDDCYPASDYLLQVRAAFADEAIGVVGGRIMLHDPSDARATVKESLHDEFLRPGAFVPAGWIHGANMAFRRTALESIGGFDDAFGAGTLFPCEDVDAVLRVLNAGWIAKYDHRPVVSHHHGRKIGTSTYKNLLRSYAFARGGYHMKCILSAPQRWDCIRFWSGRVRRQALKTSMYEFIAGALYLCAMLFPNSSSRGLH